jgi:hypothetical protein
MEALKNYSLVGCTCININTKMEDKTVMAYIYYIYIFIWISTPLQQGQTPPGQ